MNNRPDDAFTSLKALRQGAFSDEEIREEFENIQNTINLSVEKGQLKEMLKGTNTKRTLIAIGTNIFLQLTGQNFVSVYGAIFIKSLGTINTFTMSCVNTSINILVVLITMIFSDKWGRR